MAARAFSEEQMRLVRSADIIDAEGVAEVEARIAELPPNEVRELMSRMVTDPSMLSEETLAELASVLARVSRPTQVEFQQLPRELD
jgi:DNA-directed RNA polymerase subunit F